MKNDPFYLSEEASLGILSADGDFARIVSKNIVKVNNKESLINGLSYNKSINELGMMQQDPYERMTSK